MTRIQLKTHHPPKTKKSSLPPDSTKTIVEHLDELKYRLIWWLATFVVGSVIGYAAYHPIFSFLIHPLNKPLFYSSPVGGFEAVLTVAFLFGFVVSIPMLLYQGFRFIIPAFPTVSFHRLPLLIFFSFFLCGIGIAVAYVLILPAALQFLGAFGEGTLQALITTNDYFSFVIRYLLGFAILFQLPLVLLVINSISPLSPKTLLGYFRHVIVISFVIAAVLTPTPDFANQTIMAIPLIVLYLFSVLLVWGVSHKKQTRTQPV